MEKINNILRKVVRYSQLLLRYVKKVVGYVKELSKELGNFFVIVAGLVTLINLFLLEVNDVIETVKAMVELLSL